MGKEMEGNDSVSKLAFQDAPFRMKTMWDGLVLE
jgi:hypothetical protein